MDDGNSSWVNQEPFSQRLLLLTVTNININSCSSLTMEHVRSIELRCVGLIANFEGYKNLPLPQQDASKLTNLPSLEERLRAIEKAMEVVSPPPDAEPSWTGLATRLWRLRNIVHTRFPGIKIGNETKSTEKYLELMLPVADITVEVIKKAVDGIRTVAAYIEWPKHNNDEETISFALQKLCHIIGWGGNLLSEVPVKPVEMFICALRMTHLAELHGPGRVAPLPPRGFIPLQPGHPAKPKKACCTCCSCFCHCPAPVRRARSSSSERSVPRVKPVRRFQWLRELFFWKKKPVDDSSSVSSAGSRRRRVR